MAQKTPVPVEVRAPRPRLVPPQIKRAPWNVEAPEGFRFTEGPHVLTSAWTRAEAEELARTSPIEPCPSDCDCFASEARHG